MKKFLVAFFVLVLVVVAGTAFRIHAGTGESGRGWLWGGTRSSESAVYDAYDKNADNVLGNFELLAAMDDHAKGKITLGQLETMQDMWNQGQIGFNAGWISMNSANCDKNGDGKSDVIAGCPAVGTVMGNYGVNIPLSTCSGDECYLSGYAWSSNLGWIDFAPQTNCTTEIPNAGQYQAASCTQPSNMTFLGVKMMVGSADNSNAALMGFARIVGIAKETANGAGNSGGWQGWIKLNGDGTQWNNSSAKCEGAITNKNTNQCDYGVLINTDNTLAGKAWSDELGWISFRRGIDYGASISGTDQLKICGNTILTDKETSSQLRVSFWANFFGTASCNDPGAVDIANTCTWSSSDPTIISVNGSGLIKRESIFGIVNITATCGTNKPITVLAYNMKTCFKCSGAPGYSCDDDYVAGSSCKSGSFATVNECKSACRKPADANWTEVAP